jgi:hypothetical protein
MLSDIKSVSDSNIACVINEYIPAEFSTGIMLVVITT